MYNFLLNFASVHLEHITLFVINSDQLIQVNQFGVLICPVHPLTHVMVLEIPVHQLQ